MRRISVCLLLLPCFTGCSSYLASAGLTPSNFESQPEVQRWLGAPVEVSTTDQGERHVYHTRWKLANLRLAGMYGNSFGMSCGLTEPSAFGTELYKLGDTLIRGNDVEFEFDEQGEVIRSHFPGQIP